MKNTVIIKGNKYGITIVLDNEVSFSQLLLDLSAKLESAEEFFDSDKQLAISFEGRTLTNEQMDELLYVIKHNSKLNIQYVMEQNSELETTFFDIIEAAKAIETEQSANISELPLDNNMDFSIADISDLSGNCLDEYSLLPPSDMRNNNGLFYKGTLRSGQCLETKDSIIIIGDINPGANVIAGGNVVVIGSLKGSVVAGANGNSDAFVMALSMAPIFIQIADTITRNTDYKRIPKSKRDDAMIATIKDNQIHIERVSKAAIHDMNI